MHVLHPPLNPDSVGAPVQEHNSKRQLRIVGQAAPWSDVLKEATLVAATDTTVLVIGESGTGKEVMTRLTAADGVR